MTETARVAFTVAAGCWLGVLVAAVLAPPLLVRRLGRERAWPALRELLPLLDLIGTWAGTAAVLSLALGRVDFGLYWAGAMLALALMLTAVIYDRAALVPTLESLRKRLEHGADAAKWEREWAFVWRLAAGARWLTLALGAAALVCGLLA